MMSTRSLTLTTTESKAQPCPCGCAPCEQTCCQLDCVTQPRFFCGQLLTDQDLTVLLGWAQDKLRLDRFKQGWGVVCGLGVRRDPDIKDHVVVSPGYAVSCCGDDVIVCAPTTFNLGDACRSLKERCVELPLPGLAAAEEPEDVCVVDLYIHYAEKESDPQAALARSVCHQVAECEYSRTQETFRLAWKPVGDEDPVADRADAWRTEYTDWLAGQAEGLDPGVALFKIMQNYRDAVSGGCFACSEGHGVPLARVWLTPTADEGWQVSLIDIYPPQRRPFMTEPLIAPPGQVNLAPFLWHRFEWTDEPFSYDFNQLSGMLADMGLRVAGQNNEDHSAAKTKVLEGNVFFDYNISVIVHTTDLDPLGRRVIGFSEYEGVALGSRSHRRDRLARIEGIGDKSEEALYAAGYLTFADVAALAPEELRAALPPRPVPYTDEALQAVIEHAAELAEEEK